MFTKSLPKSYGLPELVDAWRSAAQDAGGAFESWRASPPRNRGAAYRAYCSSLDREERAATKLAAAFGRPRTGRA